MKAYFNAPNSRKFELRIPFEDFLASGVMRQQALLNMCEPEDVLRDYVSPDADLDDPMELRETFAEACEMATEHAISQVRFDADDILFIRRHILGSDLNPPPANTQHIQWPIAA